MAQQAAFEALRDALLSPNVCTHFDPEADLILRTDASTLGIGATLNQVRAGEPERSAKLVACYSRTLRKSEKNYSANHLECLAINESIKHFRPYLWCKRFVVQTDHKPCCSMIKSRDRKTRQGELALELNEHMFEPVYRQGKYHIDADFLSRHPVRTDSPPHQEDLLATRAVGIATFRVESRPGPDRGAPVPIAANDARSTTTIVRTEGTTETEAHRVEPLTEPAVLTGAKSEAIVEAQRGDAILGPIWSAFDEAHSTGGAPVGTELATQYQWANSRLYKRVVIAGEERLALCVPSAMQLDIIAEHHDAPTGCHYGVHKTYETLRRKYHWDGMKKAVENYVRTCKPCQLMKPTHQLRPGLYQPVRVPEEAWESVAMDTIGPIHPRSRSGNAYVLTLIDMLTKHAFAMAVPDITTSTIMSTLRQHYLTKYPLCKSILTDRGTSLMSRAAEEFYNIYGIRHVATSGFNPETNGSVEHLNGVLMTGLAIQNFREGPLDNSDWDRFLPEVVYSYNATVHVSSGYAPCELAFGVTARRPVDNRIGWGEPRPEGEGRPEALRRTDENRIAARERLRAAQEQNKRRVDKRRRDVTYRVGDRVLVYRPARKTQKGGKLSPRYLGPATIVQHRGGVNYLVTSQKHPEPKLVHVRYLKPFYVRRGLEDVHITTEADSDISVSDSGSDADHETSTTEEYFGPAEERAVLGRRQVRPPRYLEDYTQ